MNGWQKPIESLHHLKVLMIGGGGTTSISKKKESISFGII
jgi:hypothetical protein